MRENKHGAEGAVWRKMIPIVLLGILSVCLLAVSGPAWTAFTILPAYLVVLLFLGPQSKRGTKLEWVKSVCPYAVLFIVVAMAAAFVVFGKSALRFVYLILEFFAALGVIAFGWGVLQKKLPRELKAALTIVTELVAVVILHFGVFGSDMKLIGASSIWGAPFLLGYLPLEYEFSERIGDEAHEIYVSATVILSLTLSALYDILLLKSFGLF